MKRLKVLNLLQAHTTAPRRDRATPPAWAHPASWFLLFATLAVSNPALAVFQQTSGGSNIVSMEAENFHDNTPQGSHAWVVESSPLAGFSGTGVMTAEPNIGVNNDNNFLTASPRMDYEVNFVTAGVHYIRVRGVGVTGSDDSIHVGLNGQAVSTADDLHMATSSTYDWSAVNRSVTIPSPGLYTVNVWMREDGTQLDKIVLTTNSNLSLSGEGPPESSQSPSGGNQDPVARNDTFTVTGDTAGNVLAVLQNNGSGADSDPDGNPLTVTAAGPASQGGAVTINGAGNAVIYTPVVGVTGIETFSYTIGDGNGGSDSATVTVNVNAPSGGGGGGIFQQTAGSGNIVSMEAENFASNTSQGGHAWIPVSNPVSGFSGSGVLDSTPNSGVNNSTNFLTASPRLDYQVNFVTAGVHYIRVRGVGVTGSDDSIHVGLNGQAVSTADDLHMATSSTYDWSSVNRSLTIPAPGVYTINVWMREDGTQLDKIVLTTNSNLSLSGQGPPQSSQSSGGGNQDPVARNDAFSLTGDTFANLLAVLQNNGSGADSDPDGNPLTVTGVGIPNRGGSVSINGPGTAVIYTPVIGVTGIETFTYTIGDGNGGTDSATVTVTLAAPSGGGGDGAFQQSAGSGNIVSMEAENFAGNTPQGSHAWVPVTSPLAGFSGVGVLVVNPNTGVNNTSNFVTASPRLDYQVNFITAGVHYIRVRGIGVTGSDDSIHVGLNGQAVASADDLHMATSSTYDWSSVNRSLTIPAPGVYTINVWMREDGTQLDKIVLTTNSNLSLSGQGPTESTQSTGGGNQDPVARNDAFSVNQNSTGNLLAVLQNNGSGADSDPDGNPLTVTAVGSPSDDGAVSINGAGTALVYAPGPGFTGMETFTYTISDGNGGSDSATVTVTVNALPGGGAGGGGVFQQTAGSGDIVSLEAENFGSNTPRGSHVWASVSNPLVGFSGAGVLAANPNIDVNNDNNFVTDSPRLDYQVNFVTAGVHYIRVRGIGATGSDDSIHVGLNGQAVASADDLHMATGSSYQWSSVNRSLTIPTPGVYTVNVWMREDGTQLDKIVLTTNASLSLSGTGPQQSPQEGGCSLYPSVTLVSPVSGHVQKSTSLTVQTATCLNSGLHAGYGVRFVLDGGPPLYSFAEPYSVTFNGVAPSLPGPLPFEHVVTATIVNSGGTPVGGAGTTDSATQVGIGDYYVAIGDSITDGEDDDFAADDVSLDGRDSDGGYEPILNNLLTDAFDYPHTVKNEGVGGITSAGGLANLPSVLAAHPFALRYLVKYGMNDARPWLPVPSGQGLSPGNPGYPGTFKANMQQIINLINASGRQVILAKINIALGDGANSSPPYPDPNTGARSVLIQQYNLVVDELRAIPGNNITIAAPDFYSYFEVNAGSEYSDNVHPNGIGYQSMAELWCEVIAPSASCTVTP